MTPICIKCVHHRTIQQMSRGDTHEHSQDFITGDPCYRDQAGNKQTYAYGECWRHNDRGQCQNFTEAK
jgi:hypothetical protein